jgi:phosphohistidine phosphatase
MADRTELYLLRHAHAGDPGAWSGDDDLRPLSAKGEAQAERLGALLAGTGFRPDHVITSPKVRAADTARIVARDLDARVAEDDRLADNVTLAALEAVLADAGNPARALLVGHDPDFSELVGELSGATIPMRKGALARIDVRRPLRPGGGELRWLIPPDALEPR